MTPEPEPKWRRAGALVPLCGCTLVVCLAALVAAQWCSGQLEAAERARREAHLFGTAARQLAEARARGQAVTVARMPRTEAGSWAHWEAVAGRSGIPVEQLDIEPSFSIPSEGGPSLLTTTVSFESVSLRQLMAALQHMRSDRLPLCISSVEAARAAGGRWTGLVQTFLYFVEPTAEP
jgi:hypothetical protein